MFPDQLHERKRKMTFQVGLFGSDGMLLAGDTLATGTAYTSQPTKFIYDPKDPDMPLVIAQCGTQVAMRVARALIDKKWNGDRAEGERIAKEIYDEENEGVHVPLPQQATQSLIAVQTKGPSMARFDLRSAPLVTPYSTGKLVSVEYAQASLILERYYSPSLPLSRLKNVAALAVWLTGKLAPQFVDGLEMIEFPSEQTPHVLDEREIKELVKWCEKTDEKARKLFTARRLPWW